MVSDKAQLIFRECKTYLPAIEPLLAGRSFTTSRRLLPSSLQFPVSQFIPIFSQYLKLSLILTARLNPSRVGHPRPFDNSSEHVGWYQPRPTCLPMLSSNTNSETTSISHELVLLIANPLLAIDVGDIIIPFPARLFSDTLNSPLVFPIVHHLTTEIPGTPTVSSDAATLLFALPCVELSLCLLCEFMVRALRPPFLHSIRRTASRLC